MLSLGSCQPAILVLVDMRSRRKCSWGATARGGPGCFPPTDDSGSRDQEQLSSAGRGTGDLVDD